MSKNAYMSNTICISSQSVCDAHFEPAVTESAEVVVSGSPFTRPIPFGAYLLNSKTKSMHLVIDYVHQP